MGGSPQTKRERWRKEICGKRIKAETKQFDVREGWASSEADAGTGGSGGRRKANKTGKKEGRFFFAGQNRNTTRATQEDMLAFAYDKVENSRKDQKGHPKEFAFARKHKKK